MRRTIGVVALAMAPVAFAPLAFGQVYDLPELSRTQVIGATAKAHARRIERRNRHQGSFDRTAQTCANARSIIARGDSNPKLRQLRALCLRAGH